jgi:hypothetical protein
MSTAGGRCHADSPTTTSGGVTAPSAVRVRSVAFGTCVGTTSCPRVHEARWNLRQDPVAHTCGEETVLAGREVWKI